MSTKGQAYESGCGHEVGSRQGIDECIVLAAGAHPEKTNLEKSLQHRDSEDSERSVFMNLERNLHEAESEETSVRC